MAIEGWNNDVTKLSIFIFATTVQIFGKSVGEAVRGKCLASIDLWNRFILSFAKSHSFYSLLSPLKPL